MGGPRHDPQTHMHTAPRTHQGNAASAWRVRARSVALACAHPHTQPVPEAQPDSRSWPCAGPQRGDPSSQAHGPATTRREGAAGHATHAPRRRSSPCSLMAADGRDRSARPCARLGVARQRGRGPGERPRLVGCGTIADRRLLAPPPWWQGTVPRGCSSRFSSPSSCCS